MSDPFTSSAEYLAALVDGLYRADAEVLRGVATELRNRAGREPKRLKRDLYFGAVRFVEAVLERRIREGSISFGPDD